VENNLGTNIINSIEKLLRYIVPGVAFCLLFALSYPNYFYMAFGKISDSEILVFLTIFTVGISIYVIYSSIIKFLLEQIAYLIKLSPVNIFSHNNCLYDYSKSIAKLNLSHIRHSDGYPGGYYLYLWAIVHYSWILSLLLLFFAYFHEKSSWVEGNARHIALLGGALLFFSIITYFYMNALEKNTVDELERSNKTIPEIAGTNSGSDN